ncbi:hypothetical protein CPB84DRAFT_1761306 [Gymnopilus junonius]|uniref:Uncharacterized protein n=1 Tax=Gymnopilus junonius TaxID=109634 RepID=A0A9P5NZU6_GYMJU|nr:hypothetical protein CPB84DRAFT_1761306 [Gymnopilus junonius]
MYDVMYFCIRLKKFSSIEQKVIKASRTPNSTFLGSLLRSGCQKYIYSFHFTTLNLGMQ